MNLACKISLATAAIAATLALGCNFFDSNDAVNTPSPTRIQQATPATDATSHISDVPSPTLRLDPDRQPVQHQPRSTRTEPTPLNEADQKLTEDKRWCQAWALDRFDPHVYFEFAKLDPANMDDLQRSLERTTSQFRRQHAPSSNVAQVSHNGRQLNLGILPPSQLPPAGRGAYNRVAKAASPPTGGT